MYETYIFELSWIGFVATFSAILLYLGKYRPDIDQRPVPAGQVLRAAWSHLWIRPWVTIGFIALIASLSIAIEEVRQIWFRIFYVAPPELIHSNRFILSAIGHAVLNLAQIALAAFAIWFILRRVFSDQLQSAPSPRWWILFPVYIAFQIGYFFLLTPQMIILQAGFPVTARIFREEGVILWPQANEFSTWIPAILFGAVLTFIVITLAPLLPKVLAVLLRRRTKIFHSAGAVFSTGLYLGGAIGFFWWLNDVGNWVSRHILLNLHFPFYELYSSNRALFDLVVGQFPQSMWRTITFLCIIAIIANAYRAIWVKGNYTHNAKTPPG